MKTEMMMIGNARSDLELLIQEITNKTDTILNHSSHVQSKPGGNLLIGPIVHDYLVNMRLHAEICLLVLYAGL